MADKISERTPEELVSDLREELPEHGGLYEGLSTDELQIDQLTGLKNRGLWTTEAQDLLKIAHRDGMGVGMLLIDLDRFKKINDIFGHNAGDMILTTVADAMRETFRESDIIGRIGGDEMAVLLPDYNKDTYRSEEVSKNLLETVREKLSRSESSLELGISIGFAKWDGNEDLASLKNRADIEMYKMKEDGR